MTSPRPGSTIDRAMRALQSGPLPRAELARLIERDDDELDGLLRYGVRMGLLVRSCGDEDVSYALGTGEPVEAEARPAPGPMLAPPAPALAPGGAEATPAPGRPAAPAPMAAAAPAPFPAAARPPAAAPVAPGMPTIIVGPFYRPKAASKIATVLAYLHQHAPHRSDVWLSASEVAAAGVTASSVYALLAIAVKHQVVSTEWVGGRPCFQLGPSATVDARPAVKAQSVPPAASRPAAAPAPARAAANAPAPMGDAAAYVLAHLDSEIERLQRSLSTVRQRRDEFAASMKGTRIAPPQSGGSGAAASVWSPTEKS